MMGSVISRIFSKKKEKSTYQKLEEIENKIKEIEKYTHDYQQQQRRFIGNLLLYGIGSSVIAFVTFYFAFLPDTLEKKILYSIPILSLPIFIFLLKSLVSWYFQRYVNKNSVKLMDLREEKRELLDQVKNKETYKDAVEIFQRFGAASSSINSLATVTPKLAAAAGTPLTPLDRRQMVSAATNMTPTTAFKTPAPRQLPSTITSNLNLMHQKLADMQSTSTPNRPAGPSFIAQRSLKPTPYPVLDSTQKSVVDKMVDYLIGDGPSHRFAMICQQCFKHNGMALQEEYEYAAFRCAFCNFFNPAKKLRPMAPRLPDMAMPMPSLNVQRPSSSTSESSSDSDNEISKMKPSNVQELSEPKMPNDPKHLSDLDSESAVDDMEIIEKPERTDIEKKLE